MKSTSKKTTKSVPAKAANKATKKKAVGAARVRSRWAAWREPFKKVVIAQPTLSLAAAMKKTNMGKFSSYQANWVRREVLHTLNVLTDMGKFRKAA